MLTYFKNQFKNYVPFLNFFVTAVQLRNLKPRVSFQHAVWISQTQP